MTTRARRQWLCRLGVAVVGVVAVREAVAGAAAADRCQATAADLARSCQSGAESDLALAQGKCNNIGEAEQRKACRQRATGDLALARRTCAAQDASRQAICHDLGGAAYDPPIDPVDFAAQVDNPLFPLRPGATFVYEGRTAEGLEHEEFVVTSNKVVILGVTTVEVRDTVTLNGELIEDTLDWFAQDRRGNVWYFGENSRQLEHGLVVGVEGSWIAGVDGARPGIVMEAAPAVGDVYRQEFSIAVAEDVAEVRSLAEPVRVPAGSFDRCVETMDYTPLLPDAVELKFYAPGTGLVLEVDPATGERLELVRVQ